MANLTLTELPRGKKPFDAVLRIDYGGKQLAACFEVVESNSPFSILDNMFMSLSCCRDSMCWLHFSFDAEILFLCKPLSESFCMSHVVHV